MDNNLSQMVREGNTNEEVFSVDDLDLPEEVEAEATTQEVAQENTNKIEIVSLSDWFDSNLQSFDNIRKPTVSIQGVDTHEQLIVTVCKEEGNQDNRKLVVFDDAHLSPVLNLPAIDMKVYNNGFRIVYQTDSMFIKSYGIRSSLTSVFCHDINNMLIPYSVTKVRKNVEEMELEHSDQIDATIQKLTEPLDVEKLNLLYKQSTKAEGLTTNQDAVNWLLDRQGSILDVNHHLQIDNVIISLIE